MIQENKFKHSNRNLFYQTAIILLGILLGYFWYGQFGAGSLDPIVVTDVQPNDTLSKFRDLKFFDFKIFGEPSFRGLIVNGEAPVIPGVTGRTDIFAPF